MDTEFIILTVIAVIFFVIMCIQDSQIIKLKIKEYSLTSELIEMTKNFEECKQTVKVLQKNNLVCWGDLTEDEKSNVMLDIVSSRSLPSACKVCPHNYCQQELKEHKKPHCEHYKERF